MLVKSTLSFALTGGLDTKTAPTLVPNGKMLALQNARFIQGAQGGLQKRNGYNQLPQVDSNGAPIFNGSSLAVYNDQMLAFDGVGHAFAFSAAISAWAGIGESTGAFASTFNNFAVSETAIAKGLTSYSSPASATCNGVTAYAYLSGTTLNVRVVEEATGFVYYTQAFLGSSGAPRVVTDGSLLYVLSIVAGGGLQCIRVSPTQPQNSLAALIVDVAAIGTQCDACYLPSQGYIAATYGVVGTFPKPTFLKCITFNSSLSIFSSVVDNTAPDVGGALAIVPQSATGASINVCVALSSPVTGSVSVSASAIWFLVSSGIVTQGFSLFNISALTASAIPCITIIPVAASNHVMIIWQVEAQASGALRQLQFAVVNQTAVVTPAAILFRNCAIAGSGFVQGGQSFLPVVFPSTTQQNYFLLQITDGNAQVVGGAFMPDDAGTFASGGVVPVVNLIDAPADGSVYVIPDHGTSAIHVNASDLSTGTAKAGPVWTLSGTVPFNNAQLPIQSVGPFGTIAATEANEFTLPASSPFSFGNVDFSVTLVTTIPSTFGILDDQPILVSNYSHGDPNGFNIECGTNGPINGYVFFGLGPSASIQDNIPYGEILGTTLVISVGYLASTQTMSLKVNNRPIVTGSLGATNTAPVTGSQLGNFLAASPPPNFPFTGQIYELWASTDTPSDSLFASIYTQVLENISSVSQGKWSVPLPKFTQLESVDGSIQYVTGIVELVMDFTQTRVQGVQLGQSLVMTGPLVREYDGSTIVEQGFCNYPDTVTPVLLNDYANGIITTLGTVSAGAVIAIEIPSVNNGSQTTKIGAGQTTDAQLLIPPNWVAGGYATYFLTAWEVNSAAVGLYCFWYNVSGQSDPTGVGAPLNGVYIGQQINLTAFDSAATIATKTAAVLSAWAASIGLTAAGGTVTVTGNVVTVTAPSVAPKTTLLQPAFRAQFSAYNQIIESAGDPLIGLTPTYIKLPPGNCITPGAYFNSNGYTFWFTVDGVGTAPVIPGALLRPVSVLSTDAEKDVSQKVWPVILASAGISSVVAIHPWLMVFWGQDNAAVSPGTMLSSGLGLGDGTGVPGAYATDVYQFSAIYERIDTAGQLHRSEPGPALAVTIGIPSWGGGGQNSFYVVALTVPNLQLTNAAGVAIIGYQTTGNGPDFFRFTPVNAITYSTKAADSSVLIANSTDAQIGGNELLYTTGGILGNDQAPPLSFLCTHQDRLWGISDEDPNLLYYTKQFEGGLEVSWSLEQTERIDPSGGTVVSIASMDGNLIVFAQTRVWLISGNGPNAAGNGSFNLPQLVSTAVGCRDPFSVILTGAGLIFKSHKGFYLLDRQLQVNAIVDVESFNDDVVTAATLIPNTTEVRFLSASGTTLLLDTYYKQWGAFTNHQGLDACVYNGTYYYLRTPASTASRLSVYQETQNIPFTTPTDNGAAFPMLTALNWVKPAQYLQGFGRVWKALLKGIFPGVIQGTFAYDYQGSPEPSDTHTFGSASGGTWGSDPTWGAGSPWGGVSTANTIYQVKVYNRNQLCESIQLTIQDVAPYCNWSIDGVDFECGTRKGAYKRLGVGQSA